MTNAMQRYARDSTRLGIPLFLAEECPHGHMAIGTTVFPTAIGRASTWNTELEERVAEIVALEARLQGGHIGYGPVLDVARELRWSRVEEGYGEDPFLSGSMGSAYVRGLQGGNVGSGENVIATLKHFTAYGVPEGGHNAGMAHVGVRELLTELSYPFEMAVKAGALSLMTAYNGGWDSLYGESIPDESAFTGSVGICGIRGFGSLLDRRVDIAASGSQPGRGRDISFTFGSGFRFGWKLF